MTIGQYEILRNRLDGILGSNANVDLKYKRLRQLQVDLLERFECKCQYANDLFEEIFDHIIRIDSPWLTH